MSEGGTASRMTLLARVAWNDTFRWPVSTTNTTGVPAGAALAIRPATAARLSSVRLTNGLVRTHVNAGPSTIPAPIATAITAATARRRFAPHLYRRTSPSAARIRPPSTSGRGGRPRRKIVRQAVSSRIAQLKRKNCGCARALAPSRPAAAAAPRIEPAAIAAAPAKADGDPPTRPQGCHRGPPEEMERPRQHQDEGRNARTRPHRGQAVVG